MGTAVDIGDFWINLLNKMIIIKYLLLDYLTDSLLILLLVFLANVMYSANPLCHCLFAYPMNKYEQHSWVCEKVTYYPNSTQRIQSHIYRRKQRLLAIHAYAQTWYLLPKLDGLSRLDLPFQFSSYLFSRALSSQLNLSHEYDHKSYRFFLPVTHSSL